MEHGTNQLIEAIIYDHPNDQLRMGTLLVVQQLNSTYNSSGYVGVNKSRSARLDVKQDNALLIIIEHNQ